MGSFSSVRIPPSGSDTVVGYDKKIFFLERVSTNAKRSSIVDDEKNKKEKEDGEGSCERERERRERLVRRRGPVESR